MSTINNVYRIYLNLISLVVALLSNIALALTRSRFFFFWVHSICDAFNLLKHTNIQKKKIASNRNANEVLLAFDD